MAKLIYEPDDGASVELDLTDPTQMTMALDIVEAESNRHRLFVQIVIGEKKIRLVDFPPGIMQDIADQNPGAYGPLVLTTWSKITGQPLVNLRVAQTLVARAAEILGVDAPPAPETVVAVDAFFKAVPNDLPDPGPVEGGDPPTSSETSTTGSPD